ncbi:hypothetical protein [Halosolutus halophilus]|uniref:hypothetical protein n=1 Tax=Halosolutus halophilus TaxID=1552990 RepID=UPI002A59B63E|nr:hypothetical protein [Halosolutus halophilus]
MEMISARSDHRVTALAALARRPQSRADLRAMTGVSQSTIGRTLRAFEDRCWITREGRHYEATQLGAFVAAGMQELLDRLETEQTLRDIWQLLPDEADGFTIEMVSDAGLIATGSGKTTRPASGPRERSNRSSERPANR